MPNEVQTHEPRLNGTSRYVGFGELIALKVIYCGFCMSFEQQKHFDIVRLLCEKIKSSNID